MSFHGLSVSFMSFDVHPCPLYFSSFHGPSMSFQVLLCLSWYWVFEGSLFLSLFHQAKSPSVTWSLWSTWPPPKVGFYTASTHIQPLLPLVTMSSPAAASAVLHCWRGGMLPLYPTALALRTDLTTMRSASMCPATLSFTSRTLWNASTSL